MEPPPPPPSDFLAHSFVCNPGRRGTLVTTACQEVHRDPSSPDDDLGLFAVFTGHQGDLAARYCASKLPKKYFGKEDDNRSSVASTTASSLTSRAVNYDLRTCLKALSHGADRVCFERAKEGTQVSATVVAIRDRFLLTASSGLGSVVLAREKGAAVAIAKPAESGNLQRSTAGLAEAKLTSTKLLPADEFLLVGDEGLWSALGPEDAVRIARAALKASGGDPKSVADKLTYAAYVNGAVDNISVIVVLLNIDAVVGSAAGRKKAAKKKAAYTNVHNSGAAAPRGKAAHMPSSPPREKGAGGDPRHHARGLFSMKHSAA